MPPKNHVEKVICCHWRGQKSRIANYSVTFTGRFEESRDELASGYCLVIEPLKERVLFDKWPVTMDPLWDSLVLTERHGITTRQEIDTPLVERPLATLPDNNRYRVQILRRDAIIECYVAEQMVAWSEHLGVTLRAAG